MLKPYFVGRDTSHGKGIYGRGNLEVEDIPLEPRVVELNTLYKVMSPDNSPRGVEFTLKTGKPQFKTVPTDGMRGSNIKTFYDNIVIALGEETTLSFNPKENKIEEKTLYDIVSIQGTSKGKELSIYVGKKNGLYYEAKIQVEEDKLDEIKTAIEQLLKPDDKEKKLGEVEDNSNNGQLT